jgi:hypothetical protein
MTACTVKGTETMRASASPLGATFTLLLAVLVCLTLAPSARAEFGVWPGTFDGGAFDQAGAAYTQAAGHPSEAWANFDLNRATDSGSGLVVPDGSLRDVDVSIPPGFLGNPTALPACTGLFEVLERTCPANTQVGVATVRTGGLFIATCCAEYVVPVFSVEPPFGAPAAFAFEVLQVPILITARLRSDGNYGIDLRSDETSQGLAVYGSRVTIWGNPSDPAHDPDRGFRPPTGTNSLPEQCTQIADPGECSNPFVGPAKPFLVNPTSCSPVGQGLQTTIAVTSWQGGADVDSFESHHAPGFPGFDPVSSSVLQITPDQWGAPVGTTGCEVVPFDPTIQLQPTADSADTPSGLQVSLDVPQDGFESVDAISSAHLKRTTVTLPEGMTLNPSAANGLGACSDAELGLGNRQPAQCPDSSKIGTVSVDTPLLDESLGGAFYIRTQNSSDPASGELFRVAIEIRDDRHGIVVKLPGQVRANPQTGRLETTFDDNPQLPFSNLDLRLKAGPRAPLALPPTCGPKASGIVFTSWARPGEEVPVDDGFAVSSGPGGGACPASIQARPFALGFAAGVIDPVAGRSSPFTLRLTRSDGNQELDRVEVSTPKGLAASLRHVPYCSDAAIAAAAASVSGRDERANPHCPAASHVGTTTVGVGAGSSPFHAGGDVYLAGPYKGAPLSLAFVVPAVAGPFDLGVQVVRAAVHVDRRTAQVTTVSDPIPQILGGVPLRVRDIRVDIDREDFTINPTSCAPKAVTGRVHAFHGAVAPVSTRFQVGDCASLRFKPRLAMRLTGRRQTKTGRHPGVKAVVRQTGIGEAGIERAEVRLPRSLALDPDNAQALCEFAEGTKDDLENHCPRGSIVGRARAVSPLLKRPLVGNVYFVKNVRRSASGNLIRTLPMIVVALRGEIAINLQGRSSVKGGKLVNTFASLPDAPIARFNLNINGGSKGILAVTRTRRGPINLCRGRHVAEVDTDGQNGKRHDFDVRMKTPCAKRSKSAKRRAAAPKRHGGRR